MERFVGLSLVVFSALLLGGCGPQDQGIFHQTLVEPLIHLIKYFASFFMGSYGIGIIVVTLCIRLLVMPFMLTSFKKQKKMQFRMKKYKPEIDALNKKIKEAGSQEERTILTQELLSLYKKYDINPMNIGCLPMLVQMPILMALYFAIKNNAALAADNFLWFNLGTPDITMALIAGMMYLIQVYVSLLYMPEEMQKQMKLMLLVSPIMITIFSFSAPAALPLYWAVGAVILIVQQYISNKHFNYYEEE